MRIKELQLFTNDPAGTNYFYNEIIGLPILHSDPATTNFLAGNSILTFISPGHDQPVYHFAFNIPCNHFEAAMEWVGSKIPLIEIAAGNVVADFKSWNAKAFYFFDNNQNIVEMIARFDIDNASMQPFNGDAVYSVSEIGVVVQNPALFAKELYEKYRLDFFSKQKPADDFIAVGNDEGLFIIVPANRKWYPTNIRSSKHWAKLIVELPEKDVEIVI